FRPFRWCSHSASSRAPIILLLARYLNRVNPEASGENSPASHTSQYHLVRLWTFGYSLRYSSYFWPDWAMTVVFNPTTPGPPVRWRSSPGAPSSSDPCPSSPQPWGAEQACRPRPAWTYSKGGRFRRWG